MNMKDMMAKERDAMLTHKYIESEKAGRDLGEPCMVKWTKDHGAAWRSGYYRDNLMDIGDGRKAIYFGIFLDDESKARIMKAVGGIIPDGWRTICDHCTLSFGDPSGSPEVHDYIVENLGRKVDLLAVSLGSSHLAIAVAVDGNLKSRNTIPHITVAVAPEGKPVDSNKITRWEPLGNGIPISGTVDAFPSHFGK